MAALTLSSQTRGGFGRSVAAALFAAALAIAALAFAGMAQSAAAVPVLEPISDHTDPFIAGNTHGYTIDVRNSDDATASTSGLVTLTMSLPSGIEATGASQSNGLWSCAISDGGATVTCQGPNHPLVGPLAIAPGSTSCGGFGLECPISVTVRVAADVAPGTVDAELEACGGGAPSCGTASDPTEIVAPEFKLADAAGPALPGPSSFWAGTCDLASSATAVGDAPADPRHCIDWGTPNSQCAGENCSPDAPPTLSPWLAGEEPQWRLAPVTQAGAHPDATATFHLARFLKKTLFEPAASTDNIVVDLPAGFVGNPAAVPKCTAEQFAVKPTRCPPETQVGVTNLAILEGLSGTLSDLVYPVYNLEPRKGRTAEFGIPDVVNLTSVRIVGKARTSGDFGVTAMAVQVPAALPLFGQSVTLWGVPWAAEHDRWRPQQFDLRDSRSPIDPAGVPADHQASYDPSWGEIRPFNSNPTECSGATLQTKLAIDAYQQPGSFTAAGDPDLSDPDWKTYSSQAPAVTECDKAPFDPSVDFAPTATTPDSATGLSAGITVPQNNEPPFGPPAEGADGGEVDQYVDDATAHWRSDAGRATSHLDKTVVTLPAGLSVNPSGAAGLQGCSDAQVGVRDGTTNPVLFNNDDPFDGKGQDCPDGSRIGTVAIDTPLLDEPLAGQVVLGMPRSTDPQSGEMFRLFIVAKDVERGLIAKIYGSAVADPATGQLTATFDKNPRLPFEDLTVELKGGSRGMLATPQACGTKAVSALLAPWTAAHGAGGTPARVSSVFSIAGDCVREFAPSLSAGMDNRQGGASGTLSFSFARRDGEQWLRAVSAKMPGGLLASLRHVELCSDAQAAADGCPLSSQVGVVDAAAGAGSAFVLERKGRVYLTEGYKGAPYGLAVSVPVQAGPFRGPLALKTIVVRQALHVDRTTAQVTVASDPFPQIWHGIPLRLRQVTVKIDRPAFMRNPTDCAAKQIAATFASTEGASANAANRFQATRCADLGFKPRLALALKGRRQTKTGGHPAVRALVRQGADQAGIDHAKVTLPKSLALDPANAQALCEFDDGTRDDLEDHCPKASIVGRARAHTPLLKRPLSGDVYFVKNIRIDPETGNQIRTLPMIVVALRGEIAINLTGESSTTKRGNLINTFANVPDAPISRFAMRLAGGKRGILTVTRTQAGNIDLCSGRQIARANIDGHNGRTHNRRIRINTPCRKRRAPAAKVCRKRTDNRAALRRCVAKVKRNRRAAKRAARAAGGAGDRRG